LIPRLCGDRQDDNRASTTHITIMAKLGVAVLLVLLAAALWYAYGLWTALEAEMPTELYALMAGGVIFSLLVGCGLMALVFYSARHGYDEQADGNRRR